jgi:hypothetical protein
MSASLQYYEPGLRSGAWRKMRVNRTQDFVIGGYAQINVLACPWHLSVLPRNRIFERHYSISQRCSRIHAQENGGLGTSAYVKVCGHLHSARRAFVTARRTLLGTPTPL